MQNDTPDMTRRSLLTKAAIGLPAIGLVGALGWANPASALEASGFVTDNIWGQGTTSALQTYLGTPVDGVVSGQDPRWRSPNTQLRNGWEWSGGGGSALIATIQRHLGVSVDGIFGPQTAAAWHRSLGRPAHPYFDRHTLIVSTIQARLLRWKSPFGVG